MNNTNCVCWPGLILIAICSQMPMRAETRILKDVPYAQGNKQQTLDLYLPVGRATAAPLVLWIHGGGYVGGKKTDTCLSYLLKENYALASVDYRLSPEVTFPVQIQDCNAALNFLSAHAAEYGLDVDRIVVSGDSAGAQLALLLALAREEKLFGANPAIKPSGVIDFYGPSNFSTFQSQVVPAQRAAVDEAARKLFGGSIRERAALAESASPVTYIQSSSPATLIIHGEADDVVPILQSRELLERLEKFGLKGEFIFIPGAGHGGEAFVSSNVRSRVLGFLRNIFGE